MSTKEVQKEWGNKKIKPSEGISFEVKVEYLLKDYVEDCNHRLKTAMSYCGTKFLQDFVGLQSYCLVTRSYFDKTLNKKT